MPRQARIGLVRRRTLARGARRNRIGPDRDFRRCTLGRVTNSRDGVRRASSKVMESQLSPAVPVPAEPTATLAEDLPELYRAILDRVADLEQAGARPFAGRIRAQATRAYSDAWDEAARRLLLSLLTRADRALAADSRPRGWSLRRRWIAVR